MSRLAAEWVREEVARDKHEAREAAHGRIGVFVHQAKHPNTMYHPIACWILTRMRALYDARVGESDAERLTIAEREWTRDHPRAAR